LGKSRDPLGLVNEIFKPDVAGADLTSSLLSMLNKSKSVTQFPGFMQLRNISSIYKGKGEKMDLESERGIFMVTVSNGIMMKLIYQDKCEIVDSSMSDSNIGTRKNEKYQKPFLHNNGVINEILNNRKNHVTMQKVVEHFQLVYRLVRQCLL
jgi:hypothetical protein